MFKKILRLIQFLLKVRFVFKNPNISDVIIFDQTGSEILKKIFYKENIRLFILANREEDIKKIFLSYKIIILIAKNILNYSLKISYLSALIEIIKPKVILTFIDTSIDFHILSKIFYKKIKCISLQQGERTPASPGGKTNISDVSDKNLKKYFIPNFYVFSKYDQKIFKNAKAKVYNYQIIGSINAFLAKRSIKKNNFNKPKYDFCLISDVHKNSLCGMIFKYLHNLCIEENLSYIIAGDTGFKKSYELDFYQSYIGSKKINIISNDRKSYSSYLLGLKSKVIIGHRSTMLREFVGFKKKVISVNGLLLNKNIASLNIFTYKKNNDDVEWKAKSNSYENFAFHLLKVLKMSNRQYFNIFKNYEYFMHYDKDVLDTIKKKIIYS